jgi:hypothetical protein
MDSNRINLRTGSKIDPYQKNEQNPSKSCDFEWISRFCATLIGFCLFLGLFYGFESLKLRKVAKTRILGLKSHF